MSSSPWNQQEGRSPMNRSSIIFLQIVIVLFGVAILALMIVLVPLLAWTLLWSVSAIHQPPVRGLHSQWLRLLSAGMLLAT